MERLTINRAMKSLKGWDFIAIKKTFGAPLADLDNVMSVYATYWVLANRDGELSHAALMDLPYEQVESAFLAEDEQPPLDSTTETPT